MENKKIHFIGIGGIGMSGLARLYLHEGVAVSGSDAVASENTKKLEAEGAEITYVQDGALIAAETDLVVYTEAMQSDHLEILKAKELGIRTISYFEGLGEIANEYYLIAVAGTHGKTTTTAMLIDILEEASFDPSAIVGSLRTKTGSNYRAGKSKYFIVEACEYKRDFMSLEPDMLVITNIEHEHVDYYQDLQAVQSSFKDLANKVPTEGFVVTATADPNIKPVLEELKAQIVDCQEYFNVGLQLTQPGVYNQQNAAAASAAAATLGVEPVVIKGALENFAGTWRRFEYKGDCNGAPVYDDYAHHPTEIRSVISGVREKFPDKKITVAFQPHTFSRTRELFSDFVEALSLADQVLLIPIYPARKEDTTGVSSEGLMEALQAEGVSVSHFHTLLALGLELRETVTSDEVVLLLGAGEITNVAKELV